MGTMITSERNSLFLVYAIVAVGSILPLIFQKRIRRWLKLDQREAKVES